MSESFTYYERIEKAAWEARVSITKLCEVAGVNRGTVVKWQRGDSSPSMRIFDKLIAKADELKAGNKFLTQ